MRYLLSDLEKALAFLKNKCGTDFSRIEIDHLGRMQFHAIDNGGDAVQITIFDDSITKMAEVTRTERL